MIGIIKNYQVKLQNLGYYFGPCDGVYNNDFKNIKTLNSINFRIKHVKI